MTDIILDEFDLVPDQNALMRAVKPTIDGGGSMTAVSRVDKDRPKTEFKQLMTQINEHWRTNPGPVMAQAERTGSAIAGRGLAGASKASTWYKGLW